MSSKGWDPVGITEAALKVVRLAVAAPPCVGCAHWNPVPRTDSGGRPASVRLCHAEEMFQDFSCFDDRTTAS